MTHLMTPLATLSAPSRPLGRGDTLFYRGDSSESLYRLDSGLLRAVYLTAQGRHLTVRHLLPGDVFGEEALQGRPRGCQVAALTGAVVVPLHPAQLGADELRDLAANLGGQLGRLMGEVVHLQDGELRQRIARYLLVLVDTELGDQGEGGLRCVRVTHELIAEGTGATRESVSKLIGEMRDDGLLQPAYRMLTLLDEAALQDEAAGELL